MHVRSLRGAKLSTGTTTFTEVICVSLNMWEQNLCICVCVPVSTLIFSVLHLFIFIFICAAYPFSQVFINDIPDWDKYVYFNFMRFVYFKYLYTFQYFSMICTISMELSIRGVFTMLTEQLQQSRRSLYTENIIFKLLFSYILPRFSCQTLNLDLACELNILR